jgi:ribosomal protein S18 acetylase RimI-like enzyme
MYHYKTLENSSYEQLAECFSLAFSDYYFPMELTPEQLRGVLEQSGVDLALSYGAFTEDRLVGFIFNSSSMYHGQKAVFDVGTAVIPEHRGKGVFHQMFQVMEHQLLQADVDAYYLEVLKQNERAIQLYQKHGFAVDREYVVLQSGEGAALEVPFPGEECEFSQFDISAGSNCITVDPCFEHCTGVLQKNPNLYSVRYIRKGERVSAFCVYAKENGAILQLGYEDLWDLKVILQSLISTFSSIGVKNVDTSYSQVLELFYSLHFKEVTRQFEMSKQLSAAATPPWEVK